MNNVRRNVHRVILVTAIALSIGMPAMQANAASAEDLDQDALQTLQMLCEDYPEADFMSRHAKAVLVFPKIIKAETVFGRNYGEGVMTRNGKVAGYYNSVSASWDLQAGAKSYGYVLFLMHDSALQHLENTQGWELGVGPSLVFVNADIAKNLSPSTIKDVAYAYILDQHGTMVRLNIWGTKISPMRRQ